jgi:16S rRNA (guanine966-N2)-methyltransferase
MFIIGGLYRRQRLNTPKGTQTRPTASRLREALFNICQHSIEGARFLDLFAGSGAMGFEALSRGAQSATFIDSHRDAIRCIQHNAVHLGVQSKCQILHGDVLSQLKGLERQGKTFTIIYADPPYRTKATYDSSSDLLYSEQIIRWVDTHALLAQDGLLFIEEDFHSQPQLEALTSLQFIDSRRIGQAALQKYERI